MTKFINTAEAAKYLQCSASRLNHMRGEGVGPAYYKEGGRILYAVADLDAHRNSNRVQPGQRIFAA